MQIEQCIFVLFYAGAIVGQLACACVIRTSGVACQGKRLAGTAFDVCNIHYVPTQMSVHVRHIHYFPRMRADLLSNAGKKCFD